MDVIRIGDEVHKVNGTNKSVSGNVMTGNWTVLRETEDPNVLYMIEYRDGQEYDERFIRRK